MLSSSLSHEVKAPITIRNNPKIGAAYCNHKLINHVGELIGEPAYVKRIRSTRFGYLRIPEDCVYTSFLDIFCWTKMIEPMVVIKKDAYSQSSGWDFRFGRGKGNIGDGILLFGEIALKNKIYFINETLYFYRKHANQSTSDENLNQEAVIKVQKLWLEKCDKGIISKNDYHKVLLFFQTRLQISKIIDAMRHNLRYNPRMAVHSIIKIVSLYLKSYPIIISSRKDIEILNS